MRPDYKNRMRPKGSNSETSGLIVNLPSQVVIKQIPSYEVKASKIEIASIDDNYEKKKITANTNIGRIVLWEGAAYDAIGQWTDADVNNRLVELYVK